MAILISSINQPASTLLSVCLATAAKFKNPAVLALLLDKRFGDLLAFTDPNGWSAAHYAAAAGAVECLRIIFQNDYEASSGREGARHLFET